MTYSLDLRQRVVDYVEQGHSVPEAVAVFQVSKATIYRWRNRPSLSPTIVKTRRRKLDKAALQQHVRDYPEARLIDRARAFAVDPSAISYAFKRWGITVKKTIPLPSTRPPSTASLSSEFAALHPATL